MLTVGSEKLKAETLKTEMREGLNRRTVDGGAKEEMRELIEQVKPKALRERIIKVWWRI